MKRALFYDTKGNIKKELYDFEDDNEIDVKDLDVGVYFVRIFNTTGFDLKKLIIAR